MSSEVHGAIDVLKEERSHLEECHHIFEEEECPIQLPMSHWPVGPVMGSSPRRQTTFRKNSMGSTGRVGAVQFHQGSGATMVSMGSKAANDSLSDCVKALCDLTPANSVGQPMQIESGDKLGASVVESMNTMNSGISSSLGADLSMMQALDCEACISGEDNVQAHHSEIAVDHLVANDVAQAMNFGDMSSVGGNTFRFDQWICTASSLGRRGSVLANDQEQELAAAASTENELCPNEKESLQDLTSRYMYELFSVGPLRAGATESPRSKLQETHKSLSRVLTNIFAEHRLVGRTLGCDATVMDFTNSSPSSTTIDLSLSWHRRFRSRVSWIANHNLYVGLMMALTIYALFTPDFVRWSGDKDLDNPLAIVNSVVFLLYLIEMLLHGISGLHEYFCTVVFVLDLLAVLSIFLDTWFLQADILDEKSSQSARMARSARLTRLARITRIARVTRMFPALMKWMIRSKVNMAKGLIQRRLWRTCKFLDTDRDNVLTFFDFKVFYGSLMQKCSWLTEDRVRSILEKDVPMLMAKEVEFRDQVDFYDFETTFNDTLLAADMVDRQIDDLDGRSGVMQLIRKTSDNTALKICVGTLVLLAMLSLVVPDDADMSSQQGLAQLATIAHFEHASGGLGSGDSIAYICDQIGLYSQFNHPMLVVLDGWVHFEGGFCLKTPWHVGASGLQQLLDSHVSSTHLRAQEVLQLCWPDLSTCRGATSAVLLDHSEMYRVGGAWSLLDTVITIFLLLLFILILNSKIQKFSKALLYPLRTLLDDMVVLTDLELADIDEQDGLREIAWVQDKGDTEEFQLLQASFKDMRSAIRSWSKFVPPAIVQRLFSTGLEASLGVVKLEATILFCDINGFEAAVGGLSPQSVLNLLSKVTGLIADVIQTHGGTFLEFIGDEVLAVYNAPKQQKNHVYAAVLTAVHIRDAMQGLIYEAEGKAIDIQCRCGVHTGPVFAGNIGSHQRMKYGLLGDGVNLTARLKGLNSRYKTLTLVSQNVVDASKATIGLPRVIFRPIDRVAVKGKTEPTVIYEPMSSSSNMKPRLVAVRHAEAFALYRKRQFVEAKAMFEEVALALEANGGMSRDHPARMLAERCEGCIRNPPPPEWDGVEHLVKKTFEEPQGKHSGDVRGEAAKGEGIKEKDGVRNEVSTDASGGCRLVACCTLSKEMLKGPSFSDAASSPPHSPPSASRVSGGLKASFVDCPDGDEEEVSAGSSSCGSAEFSCYRSL